MKQILLRIWNAFKNIYARKVLFFSLIGIIVAAIVVGYLMVGGKKSAKVQTQETEETPNVVNNIHIEIPEGAFSSRKEFKIEVLRGPQIDEIKASYNLIGDLYDVTPTDGRDEFALKPLRIKIYFPADRMLGERYANLSLAYIKGDGPPNLFPGSFIWKDDKGYYVEAYAFHTSKIGVKVLSPKGAQKHGLDIVREVLSVKPAIIIIPGEDPRFSGELGDINFWEKEFPDRSIYIFRYPLVSPRSYNYMEEAFGFFEKTGRESFLYFEAEKLASELKKPENANKEFHIIAHGIGGLIARLALESHPEIKNVRKLILISVPSKGTNVANPLYFSKMLYGVPSDTAAKLLGLSEKTVDNLKLHIFTYIESINDYYKDVIPGSEIFKMLKSFGHRKDIKYLSIVGTTPPFDIDVKGSELEKLYPELIKDEGDGVVSVDSAKIEGVPLLRFPGSFDRYYMDQTVMNTIKAFINLDKVPTPPPLESDTYREYAPEEVVKREGLPPKEKKEKKEVEEKTTISIPSTGFSEPQGFVITDILNEQLTLSIPDYTSGGCISDQPYFASTKGIFRGKELWEEGSFQYMKNVGEILTVLKNSKTLCRVDVIGFREIKDLKSLNLENVIDLLITDDGNVYALKLGEGGTIKLMVYDGEGFRLVDKNQGTSGRLIPLSGNEFIFLTDKMLTFVDRSGSVIQKLSLSSIAKPGYALDATYALKVKDKLYILTSQHYMMVYDMKEKESYMVGNGWTGKLKLIYAQKFDVLVILGKNFVMFADLKNRMLLKYIQRLDYEVVDGFVCSGKLYVVGKSEEGYKIHVYSLGAGVVMP